MEVRLLGSVEAVAAGSAVELRGDRLRALLARLALDGGRLVTVSTLAASLWDEDEIRDEVNAVQSLVSRLRRALPDPGVLESSPSGYRLVLDPDAVDATAFAHEIRAGRERWRAGDAAGTLAALTGALELWRGQPLSDVGTAPFAAAERARLEELRLGAREDRIEAALQLGLAADVLDEVETLVATHPLRERLRGLQLQVLGALGRQADALQAYEALRQALAEELGVDPAPDLQAQHLALLRGELGRPAAGGRAARAHGPRAALTSFVGRDADMAALAVRLREHRLVTLVGPGGAGKTRLAAETADRLERSYPGGTWFATLAPLDDPRDLAHAVVGMLGLRESAFATGGVLAGAKDPRARLVEAFAEAPALLVMDNCEHLVEAAADLTDDLLARCPQLHVLATSREPLGIVGEELAPVLPLERPEVGSTAQQAQETASVRLFAERAASVSPGFTVDDTTVDAVVEICRRLDGLPLAIELAAARLRTMGVGQVAARLDDRFKLLTGGSRTALPRHRTLRAVVAWSWDLLDPAERDLAERVAVFPGGVTPDSAEAVSGLSSGVVLDLLAALVEKSLLHVVDPEEPRYRMLETIREFGVEQLAAREELAAARRAHSLWATGLAERADQKVTTAEQMPWIRLLMAERDNINAALRFAVDTDDVETASRLTAGMSSFWMLQSNHDEALTWAAAVCAMPGPAPAVPMAVVVAVRNFSLAMTDFGNTDRDDNGPLGSEALAEMEAAIEAAGGVDAHRILAFARPILAMSERDDDEALRLLKDGMAGSSDPWTRATLTFLRGMILQNRGDQAAFEHDLADAREQFAELGDRWGWAMTEFASAELHIFADDVDVAIKELESAVALMAEVGAVEDVVQARVRLAGLEAQIGRPEAARASLAAAEDAVGTSRLPRLRLTLAMGRAAVALESGEDEDAERVLQDSLPMAEDSIAAMYFRAAALTMLGFVSARHGDPKTARARVREAYRCAAKVTDMPILAMTVAGWAYVDATEGEPQQAAHALGLAAVVRGVDDRGPGLTRHVRSLIEPALGHEEVDRLIHETLRLEHAAALAELDQLIGADR